MPADVSSEKEREGEGGGCGERWRGWRGECGGVGVERGGFVTCDWLEMRLKDRKSKRGKEKEKGARRMMVRKV